MGVDPEDEPGAEDAKPGSAIARIMLGSQLRQLREAAGVTVDQAAWLLRSSRSKVSRMETGRVGFKVRDVSDLLEPLRRPRPAAQGRAAGTRHPGQHRCLVGQVP